MSCDLYVLQPTMLCRRCFEELEYMPSLGHTSLSNLAAALISLLLMIARRLVLPDPVTGSSLTLGWNGGLFSWPQA